MLPIPNCCQLFLVDEHLDSRMGHIFKHFELRGPPRALPPPPGQNDHRRPGLAYGPPSDKWAVLDWHPDNPEGWMWRLTSLERVSRIPPGHLPPHDFVMAPAKRKEGIHIVVSVEGQEVTFPNVHFFGRVWPSK